MNQNALSQVNQPIWNYSGYRFTPLDESLLEEKKERFKKKCRELGLKGTVVFSPEGVNIAVAGNKDQTFEFQNLLESVSELKGLSQELKLSHSQFIPFNRMLVKIKKSLVPITTESSPHCTQGPSISPKDLKKWLDENKDFILLDTRNGYECRIGKFNKAIHFNLKHFRYFPENALPFLGENKEKPVVMYCTGGIRCEKASPFLLEKGFKNVFQLEGGILKYFEECGGAHFDGECFVFDDRVAVDPSLKKTATRQCYECREPLTLDEQMHPDYILGVSCPYCSQKN